MVKLLNLLTELQEANFSMLRDGMKASGYPISENTLTVYIKILEGRGDFERFDKKDRRDRREKWYRIKNKEHVDAQVNIYEANQFIENLKNPIYVYDKDKGRTTTVSVFCEWSNVQGKDRVTAEKRMKKAIWALPKIFKIFPMGDKFALVVTKSKKPEELSQVEK